MSKSADKQVTNVDYPYPKEWDMVWDESEGPQHGEEFRAKSDGTYWPHAPLRADRLLNVARALRESMLVGGPPMEKLVTDWNKPKEPTMQPVRPDPSKFTMAKYAHDCGTPACALGHYAARTDLQDLLVLNEDHQYYNIELGLAYRRSDWVAHYHNTGISQHFGLTSDELEMLFSEYGCGGAKTPEQAAQYIEAFVEARLRWDALSYEEREKHENLTWFIGSDGGGLPHFPDPDDDGEPTP